MAEPHVQIEDPWAAIPEALLYDPGISHLALRVYGCLRRHGADPRNCFPSYERIGALLGVSDRSVQRPIKELAAAGWITVIAETRDDGGRTSNRYIVHSRPRSDARTPPRSTNADPPALPARAEGEQLEREERASRDAPPSLLGDPFETLWKSYPACDNKGAKNAAKKEWLKRSRDVEAVMAGLARWQTYWTARDEPEFICAASKWIREERWNMPTPAVRRIAGPTSYDDAPVRYV